MRTQKSLSLPASIRAARQETRRAELLAERAANTAAKSELDLDRAFADARETQRKLAILAAREADQRGRPFLACLAQGDSWFNYSVCGRSIITNLERMLGAQGAFYNLAQPGRLLRDMMMGSLLKQFETALSQGLDAKHPWNVVLLSGGGNDMCGNGTFVDWLKPFDGGSSPDALITDDFNTELENLRQLYDEAAALVATKAPRTKLFIHGYDYAIPDGRCVRVLSECFAGPWMWPAFDKRGFHKGSRAKAPLITIEIVAVILRRFQTMIEGVATRHPHVRVVQTQGTLPGRPASWANELHPTNPSFEKIAQRFYSAITASHNK